MERPFRYITVEQHGPISSVRLRQVMFSELELGELGTEIARLVDEDGCRKLMLFLGPEEPQCLYSVFLAKLINLQKRLEKSGGKLVLAELSPTAVAIVEAAGLDNFSKCFPDFETVRQALQ